ncbi:MAG: hypothetical protein JO210_08250 [Acidobacteriaceae bacterium]|nr:hypothetical protein [Acidobacteriaceae bacterium]
MTRAEVFSFSLLLTSGARAEKILALLEEDKLDEVRAAIKTFGTLAPSDIRQLWSEQRKIEEHVQLQAAKQRFGFEEERLAPALVKWLVRRSS